MPWLIRFVADLSQRRPEFESRPVHVRFVVEKYALRQVFFFLLEFRVSPVNIVQPLLHTHLSVSITESKGCNARNGESP